jgi:hypothetical protein
MFLYLLLPEEISLPFLIDLFQEKHFEQPKEEIVF